MLLAIIYRIQPIQGIFRQNLHINCKSNSRVKNKSTTIAIGWVGFTSNTTSDKASSHLKAMKHWCENIKMFLPPLA